MDDGENWLETDPNNPDTDGDGLSDGNGEDLDSDGLVNGDTNRNRTYDSGEAWTETDPLNRDTDGDGLTDGWETSNGLDPLDNGQDNLRTIEPGDGSEDQLAYADPDNDGFTNTQEQASGTRPLVSDESVTLTPDSIIIGLGKREQHGLAINENAFTDWTPNDLVALDEFEGDGTNAQDGDTFSGGDGFDSSRDIVAFYARDGGSDGNFYFRFDFHDLQPYAEEGRLDLYVVIDTGNTNSGESALPDELDIRTDMRWEAVVACYHSGHGRVFIDLDPTQNTNAVNENLSDAGVVARGRENPNGFGEAYFNSQLDAAEFSISRQALIDAGWNGSTKLRYQVFTTKDGTQNEGGGGDIGGRNDLRDTIYDDWLSEDYWSAQAHIAANGKLSSHIEVDLAGRYPDQGKCAKAILLLHANHAILAGSEIQPLINTGHSTGYHRTLDAHQAFNQPFALHITPTLASAIQWAAVNPDAEKPWLDGPTFNDQLSLLAQDGRASLLGTTFADHIPRYFTDEFNRDSTTLAGQFFQRIYHALPSTNVLWNPERVADDISFRKIASMGFNYTFIDQMRHFWLWQGRQAALSADGYRLNRYHGINCFLINEQASRYRYQNHDHGLPMALRRLYHRKARSGTQDQVIVLYHHWDEIRDWNNASAYDTSLRWAANKPWIRISTPQEIAGGQVDINSDGNGDSWHVIDRGSPDLPTVAHDWLQHATEDDYDNWYNGLNGIEEGLKNKVFESRPGTALPHAFGTQGAQDGKLADLAWDAAFEITNKDSLASLLARTTAQTSVQLTAFHEQTNNDLTKYSTGEYVWPDISQQSLSLGSRNHHSQIRFASVYAHVDAWTQNPPNQATATSVDVDLDGQPEHLLSNSRIFAIIEPVGGRLVAAWARDSTNGKTYQVVGNYMSYSGSDTEFEGTSNNLGDQVDARRTSAFKDWWAKGPEKDYVNELYSVTPAEGAAWTLTSPDGHITKTFSLADTADRIHAAYSLTDDIESLYIRFGLSPNLYDLLLNGQAHLKPLVDDGSRLGLANKTFNASVTAALHYSGNKLVGSQPNLEATDHTEGSFEPETMPMRNQAQTQQFEIESTAKTFSLALEISASTNDGDNDGLPDAWEAEHGLSTADDGSTLPRNGPQGDPDGDGVNNLHEFLLGLKPTKGDASSQPQISLHADSDGSLVLEFPTLSNRLYQLYWSSNLVDGWTPFGNLLDTTGHPGTDNQKQILDANENPRSFFKLEIQRP